MMELKKKKMKFGNCLKKIEFSWKSFFLIFLYLQPILDVIFSLSVNYFKLPFSINTIIRMTLLVIAIFYLIFINKNKATKIASLSLLIYIAIFILNIYFTKERYMFYEAKNMLSTFFFPICLLFIYQLFKDKQINIKNTHLFNLSLIYLAFIIIPNVLGIGFPTYTTGKSGNIGWFYSANAISSVLIMLVPINIVHLIINKDYIKCGVYVCLVLYTFVSIGTKAPLLGLILACGFLGLYLIVHLIKKKDFKKLGVLILSTLLACGLLLIIIPKTTFYKNIKLHMNRFGASNILEIFGNKELVNQVVFSRRLDFWARTKESYQASCKTDKIIGIGYIENAGTIKENYKIIEIDYLDIYYRHSLFGFILYFIPLIAILFDIIKYTDKLTIKNYTYFVSVILALLLAFFTGHVFTAPAVSIILIFIICNINKRSQYE